jgi:hypothetical protein
MNDPITLIILSAAATFGAIATWEVISSKQWNRIQKALLISLAWLVPLAGAMIVMIFFIGPGKMRRRQGRV